MCHYITLVVENSNQSDLDLLLRRFGRRAKYTAGKSIQAALRPNETQYLTYEQTCDCGTVLAYDHNIEVGLVVQDTSKLKARGWTNAKIERWLEDTSKKESLAHQAAIDGIELWKSITDAVLELPNVKSTGLVLHNYQGSIEDEQFEITRRLVDKHEFDSCLAYFKEDELLMTRGPARKLA